VGVLENANGAVPEEVGRTMMGQNVKCAWAQVGAMNQLRQGIDVEAQEKSLKLVNLFCDGSLIRRRTKSATGDIKVIIPRLCFRIFYNEYSASAKYHGIFTFKKWFPLVIESHSK
jgi:hypothetical protein